MVMVGLVAISRRNGMIIRIRRIKRQQRIVDYLIMLIILDLLIQMELGVATKGSAVLIKLIPLVWM